eukprot:3908294-Prymnesium_polylepis.1
MTERTRLSVSLTVCARPVCVAQPRLSLSLANFSSETLKCVRVRPVRPVQPAPKFPFLHDGESLRSGADAPRFPFLHDGESLASTQLAIGISRRSFFAPAAPFLLQ